MDVHKGKRPFSPKTGVFRTILWKKVSRDKKNPGNRTLFGAMTKNKYLGGLLHVTDKSLYILLCFF